MKLAALYSGGKDSNFAIFLAKKQHEIACLITIKSKNIDSYMFHTPNIHLTELQAKALNLPLIEETTKGEKEIELKDLERAIKKAKEKYNIQGVLTGALFSNYQRERIEKIAKKLNLKTISPLWHMDQEKEMRELIKNNFTIILTSIAAQGLDESWLNKRITDKDIDKLTKIEGINIAGEGGEFETLVLDCPLFNKKLEIKESTIIKKSEHVARLIIKKAELIDK